MPLGLLSKNERRAPPEPCAGLARCCELLANQLAEMGKQKPAGIGDFAKDVTTLAGAATGISFVFYLFGFIIVNLHLLSLGVRSFNLADPAFLPAGIAFVFFAIGPLLLFVYPLLQSKRSLLSRIIGLAFLYLPFVGAGCLMFVAGGAGGLAEIDAHGGFLGSTWSTFGWGAISAVSVGAIVLAWSSSTPSQRAPATPSAVFVGLVLLIVTLSQWSTRMYGSGNPAFGGGRPASVVLVLKLGKDGGVDTPGELGLAAVGNVTTPVRLITENDKTVVILNDSGQALSLDRSLVAEIRYSPR
jgi:hypothetical protein